MRKADTSRNYADEDNWDDLDFLSETNRNPYRKQGETDSLTAFLGTDFWDEGQPSAPKRKKSRSNSFPVVAMLLVLVAGVLGNQLFSGKPRADRNQPPAVTAPASTQKPTIQPSQPTPTQPQPTQLQPVVTGELRYFGEKLGDWERQAYCQLAEALPQFQTSVELLLVAQELDIQAVTQAICWDYPEYFWFRGGGNYVCGRNSQGLTYTITLDYFYPPQEAREHAAFVESAIQPVLNQLRDQSDYEKVKGVYEYLIEHTIYDYDYIGMTVYEVFHDGRAVCEGYAKATQLLLSRLGVQTLFIVGEACGRGFNWESHAWNLVELDGDYYQLDTTWGDPLGDEQTLIYNYLNLTDEECYRDHRPDDPSLYPVCNATRYNYFRYEGYYLESFDKARLSAWVQAVRDGQRRVSFRCADESLYRQVRTWLFDNGGIWELCPDLGEYFYNYNDTLFTIRIEKT